LIRPPLRKYVILAQNKSSLTSLLTTEWSFISYPEGIGGVRFVPPRRNEHPHPSLKDNGKNFGQFLTRFYVFMPLENWLPKGITG
jgi:hypothetical protein